MGTKKKTSALKKVSKRKVAPKKSKAKKTAKKSVAKKTVAKKAAAKKPAKAAAKKRAKKVSKAKPAKKATKKAPAAQLQVYRLGKDAPNGKYFILANGKPVKHVAELAVILEDLEDHVFDHHVNPERNDFHNWVREVFKDVELAKKMLGVNTKQDLQLTIYKHVAHKTLEGR